MADVRYAVLEGKRQDNVKHHEMCEYLSPNTWGGALNEVVE